MRASESVVVSVLMLNYPEPKAAPPPTLPASGSSAVCTFSSEAFGVRSTGFVEGSFPLLEDGGTPPCAFSIGAHRSCSAAEMVCDQFEACTPGMCCREIVNRRVLPDGGGFWPDASEAWRPLP